MTQRNLEDMAREKAQTELKKELTHRELRPMFDIVYQLGGLWEFRELLKSINHALRYLSLEEIQRALKREEKISAHYRRQKEGGLNRGGRKNKVGEIVMLIQDAAENFPTLLQARLKQTAKYHGGYAPPETRISHTSQWRVNKKLKELEIDPVPWGDVRGVFTEEELEHELFSRTRIRKEIDVELEE